MASYDLGAVVPLSVTLTDTTGAPANGGTVTVAITQPDGTIVGPVTVTPAPTGVYNYTFTPTQPGRYSVKWLSTGANSAPYSDAFDVNLPDPGYLLSIATVKSELKMTSTSDALVAGYLRIATEQIEHLIGPVVQRPYTDTVPITPTIVLPRAPVVAVSAMTVAYPLNTGYLFNVSDYLLDPDAGILRRLPTYGWGWSGLVTVAYTAGRQIVPESVQTAAVEFVRELARTGRGAMPVPASGASTDDNRVGDSMIPEIVFELLAPYLQAGRIA